jgi:hypothetical protein
MRVVRKAIAAIVLSMWSMLAIAQPIDIKGLYVGMPKDEVLQKYPTWNGFTVAGVTSKYPQTPVRADYVDDRLDSLWFAFDPASFSIVLAAVKDKYPGIACEQDIVSNAMGAKFEQNTCMLSDELSILRLVRYAGDLRTASLTLVSKRRLNQIIEQRKAQKKDI